MPPLRAARRRLTVALSAIAMAAGIAAAPVQPAISPADDSRVVRAVAYLEGLTDAKGRFVQTDARGLISRGEVYLHRPGKVRFQYDPPSGMVVASDGRLVSILDPRLKSFQNYPLRITPLAFLLGKDIRLGHGAAVTGVSSRPGGFAITVREAHGKMQGAITLAFTDRPLALTGWTIVDARGAATQVRLVDFGPVGALNAGLFDLRDPRAGPSPERRHEFGLTN